MCSLSVATNVLKNLETSSSIGMFARDTGGCLISRLGLSRTKDESKEIGFAELTESAIFYFSAPALAKASSDLFAKHNGITKLQLATPFKELKNIKDAKTLKAVKLGKFGQIASTFSIILPLVFGIAPLRNLMTAAGSGKKEFTAVVGLENKNHDKNKAEAKQKAVKLLKVLGSTAVGCLGVTAGIMTLAKNKNVYKKLEPVLDKTFKHLDFTKNCDLELAHYGALIYPVSIASYFYASRDKYEKLENARRFSITVPLMFFGEKLIQNPIYKKFDKIFKTNVMENGNIKSYKDILKLPKEQQKQMLKSKNFAYGSTFFINTMAIAAAVALLNRFETKRNFEKDKNNSLNVLTDSNSQGVK